jgi:cytidylate kinase
LIEKGISANLEDLLADMRVRDARDTQRSVAPLIAAKDAHVVDSSTLTIDQTVQSILDLWSRFLSTPPSSGV